MGLLMSVLTVLDGVGLVGFEHQPQELGGLAADVLNVDPTLLQIHLMTIQQLSWWSFYVCMYVFIYVCNGDLKERARSVSVSAWTKSAPIGRAKNFRVYIQNAGCAILVDSNDI